MEKGVKRGCGIFQLDRSTLGGVEEVHCLYSTVSQDVNNSLLERGHIPHPFSQASSLNNPPVMDDTGGVGGIMQANAGAP